MTNIRSLILFIASLALVRSFSVLPRKFNAISTPIVLQSSEGDGQGEVPIAPEVKCPDCDLCDGSGRILGGLGAVLPWMPVKAYRPCPNFIDRGGRYERSGQPLDEIAFGRDSTYDGSS